MKDVHRWRLVRYHERCWISPTNGVGVEFQVFLELSAKCPSGVVTRTWRMHERNVEGVFG